MVDCPYCKESAQLVSGKIIYPHRPDLYNKKFWFCDNGHESAYVGCHGNGERPLGRLADARLRQAKSAAHRAFDPLWRNKVFRSRGKAYNWLADKMRLPSSKCHIGMFDINQCQMVVNLSREKLSHETT